MPKQSRNKAKTKAKLKINQKIQPEAPGFTTKKSYWVMLSVVMVSVFSVAGYIMGFTLSNIVVLMVTILVLIGLMGYIRVTPSSLSKSRRGTFLFVGASFIGFGIWAAIMLVLIGIGLLEVVFVDPFLVFPSLVICLTVGAFIGELLGKNSRVRAFFFKPEDVK
ncbi:MAG: hypothetical protein ACFCUE_05495 [Candidatus Bathyarchaeia archaeon]|jgi:FtsH-binding integral membrane protein